jgi:hypothetical protein
MTEELFPVSETAVGEEIFSETVNLLESKARIFQPTKLYEL